jgi:DNA-binding MarR family transcriptional regulator
MPTTSTSSRARRVQLAARLRLAVLRLARRLRQQAEVDVTPSMQSVLSTLERVGPATFGELAELERVRPPTITRIVARLEGDGLVKRETDNRDRRVSYVRLTREGRQLMRRTRSRKDLFLVERLARLDEDHLTALENAVEALERLLEEEPE